MQRGSQRQSQGWGWRVKAGTREKESETKNDDLGSNDDSRGRQDVSQESKLKYLNELFDDYVDSLTRSKPNGKQSKIRKYFTNLTVRDKSEVNALIYETCGGG